MKDISPGFIRNVPSSQTYKLKMHSIICCVIFHRELVCDKKTGGSSKTGPYKLELFSCGHLDAHIFFLDMYKFSMICFGNCNTYLTGFSKTHL